MPNINLIGTEPDQIPTNADLGTLAFQDQDYVNVGNLIVATVDVTTEARFARFSTANALITGGSLTGGTGEFSTLTATNFSSANAEITGTGSQIGTDTAGAVSRIANVYATLGNFTNFSTANAVITGGSATHLVATNFSSGNAQITGGTINLAAGNITAGNIFITNTRIQNYEYNAVTTKSYVDTMLIIFGT
jgi:hypothetical protein